MAIEKIPRVDGTALPLPGDNIDTDRIIPARFLKAISFEGLEAHLFIDDRAQIAALGGAPHPFANPRYDRATILVVNANFGCGSSREQAASCLEGHELVVIARSFARIFLQNAINLGLRVTIAPSFEANEGDEVDFEGGRVLNRTSNRAFEVVPLPKARQAIIDAGGLVPYTRARLVAAESARGAPRAASQPP